jgi:hypothetical protein
MDHRDIEERLSTLEQHAVLRSELRTEIKRAAHELRDDSSFARPYWQTGADHISNHWFDKAARRLLWLVLGILGTAGFALAMFLAGKGIK